MTEHQTLIRQLFLPDGGPYALSSAMSARSGSGKTTLLTSLINAARTDSAFNETRFIYVSVKKEHLFKPMHKKEKIKPVSSVWDAVKSMRKNQITVFYPSDPAYYEEDVDSLIDSVFDLADSNPEASFSIVLDDANVLKGFDNRGNPSPQVKKLAIAGRSKRIRGLFITHRLGNLPRIMNGNLSALILMSIPSMDVEYSRKVFGVDFEPILPELHSFRWAVVDLLTEHVHTFNPISPK